MIKYTPAFLHKLEDLFAESDYILRYEKGKFTSGFCVLKESKLIMVNNFFPLEGKINCLIEILKTVPVNTSAFSEKNLKFYQQIRQETEQISLDI